ncbi:MAG: hypothetical protein Q8P11_02300 [bacterium]|nr:hypothetical protein [bacterium]
MKYLRILLIFLVPALITVAMLLTLGRPEMYFYALGGSIVAEGILLFFLFPRQERTFDVINIAFPVVVQMILAWIVLFFVEDPYSRYAIVLAHVCLQYIFLINVYYFLYKFERYQKRALPHITSYMGIINVFYSATIVYALGFYLEYPIWYTVWPLLLLILLILIQNLWIHDISIKQRWYYVAVIMLVLTQLIFVIQILPTVYFVNAFMVVVYYYLAVHLGLAVLQKEMTRRELIRNGVIVVVVILLVLLTTRWR